MSASVETEERRRSRLEASGAPAEIVPELLAYGAPLLGRERSQELLGASFADEPHVEAWTRYAAEAARSGTFAALAGVFAQLRYPVRKGISETEGYRSSTRRGTPVEADPAATGLVLRRPDLVTLSIHATLAGRIPILVAGDREDFETLVRALSARNEPIEVPSSMGACFVRGFNNWDRVHTYRAAWQTAIPFGDWNTEFERLAKKKELYQDRFILLSTGPYSAVPAAAAGYPPPEWLRLSLVIRREHEATHYFTLRATGTARNNLVDELIADYVALVRAVGSYREDLARLFFGLEAFPAVRENARLLNYRGDPPLSDAAFTVATRLVSSAIGNLARLDAAWVSGAHESTPLADLVLSLAGLGLEELATSDLTELLPRRDVFDPTATCPALVLPTGERLALRVRADGEGVDEAVDVFDDFARRLSLPDQAAFGLHLVLDEVLSNTVKYGYDEPSGHHIEVEVHVHGGAMEMVFVDDAREFDPLATVDPDVTSPLHEKPAGGLGIYLVKKLTDSVRYERADGKNRLRVVKRI